MAIVKKAARLSRAMWAGAFLLLGALTASTANASGPAPGPISWENRLRPAVVAPGKQVPHWSLRERMAFYHVPGVAVAVIRNGDVVKVAGYGVLAAGSAAKVNADTLFSAGSVSKVATAALLLRMVAAGKLGPRPQHR